MASRGNKRGKQPDLDYVLLCLIRIHGDASGYQLRTFIEESTGYLYRAHLSQIYPALKRLNELGWVTFTEVVREGKPDLKLYQITDDGIAAAEKWLTSPFKFDATRESADRFLMRLVLMGHLESDKIVRYIDECFDAINDSRQQYEESSLERKLAFLSDKTPDVCARYELIWQKELAFVLAEYDLRLECLRDLRDSLS